MILVICEEDLFKSMSYLVLREVDCVSEGVESLPAIVLPQSVLVWSLVIILVITDDCGDSGYCDDHSGYLVECSDQGSYRVIF